MRRQPTPAEAALWDALRGRAIGWKFRRQHPFGRYILDFYCAERRLCIEVDGGIHSDPWNHAKDQVRDRRLRVSGVRVLRFTNRQVLTDLPMVLESIRIALAAP
jgi:very-short-patch-repair endonuclease